MTLSCYIPLDILEQASCSLKCKHRAWSVNTNDGVGGMWERLYFVTQLVTGVDFSHVLQTNVN